MLTTVIERGGLLSAARPASASRSDGLITACASHRTMWSPNHRTVQVVLDGAIGVKRFTYWVFAVRVYSLQWVSSMGRWRHVGLPRLILAARSSASRHIGLRGCGRFLTRPGIGRVHGPVARHCGVRCAELAVQMSETICGLAHSYCFLVGACGLGRCARHQLVGRKLASNPHGPTHNVPSVALSWPLPTP